MKNRPFVLLLVISVIYPFLISCVNEASLTKKDNSHQHEAIVSLQLLAFNDFHGQISFATKAGSKPAGSVPVLDAYLKFTAAKEKNTIFISAGDHVGASALSSALLQDEPSIQFFNQLGNNGCSCDSTLRNEQCNLIAIPGNHEFDAGLSELHRLFYGGNHKNGPFLQNPWKGAAYPVVCANIRFRPNNQLLFPPYVIKHIDGIPVAFIGATYKETPSIVKNADIDKLVFQNEAEAINSFVPELKNKGIKAIIAIIHNGGMQTPYTGSTVPDLKNLKGSAITSILEHLDPEIDVVVTAHTHSFTNILYKTKRGNTLLVTQALSKGAAFADIDLAISKKTGDIVDKCAQVIVTYTNKGPASRVDHRIVRFVKDVNTLVAPIINRPIGSTSCDISKTQNSAGESPLGNLITDAERYIMGTDFAFINPSGMRTSLRSGNITWGKLYYIQPYNNRLIKMTLTGQQIIDLLNQQWINRSSNPSMLQVSGFTYSWRPQVQDSNRVIEVYKDNTPIDRTADYTITVTSFLSEGGDNFSILLQGRDKAVGPVDLKALEQYISTLPNPFGIDIEKRISLIEPAKSVQDSSHITPKIP